MKNDVVCKIVTQVLRPFSYYKMANVTYKGMVLLYIFFPFELSKYISGSCKNVYRNNRVVHHHDNGITSNFMRPSSLPSSQFPSHITI